MRSVVFAPQLLQYRLRPALPDVHPVCNTCNTCSTPSCFSGCDTAVGPRRLQQRLQQCCGSCSKCGFLRRAVPSQQLAATLATPATRVATAAPTVALQSCRRAARRFRRRKMVRPRKCQGSGGEPPAKQTLISSPANPPRFDARLTTPPAAPAIVPAPRKSARSRLKEVVSRESGLSPCSPRVRPKVFFHRPRFAPPCLLCARRAPRPGGARLRPCCPGLENWLRIARTVNGGPPQRAARHHGSTRTASPGALTPASHPRGPATGRCRKPLACQLAARSGPPTVRGSRRPPTAARLPGAISFLD